MEIRYSRHFDLIFHALAHLKVNNAADCYSEEYMEKIREAKRGSGRKLASAMEPLREYYNKNFNRAQLINFLPFHSGDYEEMKSILLNWRGFTDEDMRRFIRPFLEILDEEKDFYFNYWDDLFERSGTLRRSAEEFIKGEFDKYSRIFEYYKKTALAVLSYAITRNGRGYDGIEGRFTTLAPFPGDIERARTTFFWLLHEYTHQFTDALLRSDIRMDDGSHNTAENVVMLADYYLVKAVDGSNVQNYIKWLWPECAGEEEFTSSIYVGGELDREIKNLIGKITERRIV